MLTALTVALLIVGFVLLKLVVITPMRENYVLERFGNFRKVLTPGFHVIVPFLDRIAYRHDMREQVLDIPAQSCITRDNIQVSVDGLVYLKVMDARKASYGIGNYATASVNLAQTTMRSEVGKLSLGEAFKERDNLNEAIVAAIDKASDPWGVKVLRYEVRNITPSRNVIHTLEKQMEAERAKRAEVTLANAMKESKILISEGHRQEAINISEGEKQKRINVAEGRAQSIAIVAEATAEGLKDVAQSIRKPGGASAVKMKLARQFIDQLERILRTARISVLPSDLANLQGVLTSLREAGFGGRKAPGGQKS